MINHGKCHRTETQADKFCDLGVVANSDPNSQDLFCCRLPDETNGELDARLKALREGIHQDVSQQFQDLRKDITGDIKGMIDERIQVISPFDQSYPQ